MQNKLRTVVLVHVWLHNEPAFNHVCSIFRSFGSLHRVVTKLRLTLRPGFGSYHITSLLLDGIKCGLVRAVISHFRLYPIFFHVPSLVFSREYALLIYGRFPARFMASVVVGEIRWETWSVNHTSSTTLCVVLHRVTKPNLRDPTIQEDDDFARAFFVFVFSFWIGLIGLLLDWLILNMINLTSVGLIGFFIINGPLLFN